MKRIFILLFLFVSQLHDAQDSTYVKDFSDKINVRLGVDTNIFSYKIKNKTTNGILHIKPNETERLTFGLVHRFLVLNVEYAPHFYNNELRGQSEIQSIQMRIFRKRFIQHFSYHNIRGFYLANTTDYIPNWNKNQPYITYNDLGIKRISGKTTFVVNRNFSYKAIAFQSQKQMISVGSFMPSISYYYTQLHNFRNAINVYDENNYDLNFNVGYIHNFVFGKEHNYYASVNLSPGLGVKMITTVNEKLAINKQQAYTNSNLEGGINVGYNSDQFFTGLMFNSTTVSYNRDLETNIENANVYVHLFFGYRFGSPKPVTRFFDQFYKYKS